MQIPTLNQHIVPYSTDALLQYIKQMTPKWVELLQQLIRIPSEFENEHQILDFVGSYISKLGLEPTQVSHEPATLRSLQMAQLPISKRPGRCSLAVRVPGGSGRSLALNAHLDAVPAGDLSQWVYSPFSGYIDQATNYIYGRGAWDDKAGVAIALAVLETAVSGPLTLSGDLVVHLVIEDEATGNGSLLCLQDGFTADAAIIIDGTRLDRAIAMHAGNLQFGISLSGKTASVAVSHMGINAAEMMSRLLLRMREAIFALNSSRTEPWTQFPSPYQFVIQSIHSDGALMTLPESATAECHLTFPPPHNLQRIRQLLTDEAAAFAAEYGLESMPKLDWSRFHAEPAICEPSQLHSAVQTAARSTGLDQINIGPSTGTSDLRHFVAKGIPCLLYGPGRGFNPHRANEHYCLEDLPVMVKFFANLLQEWGSGPRSACQPSETR